MLRRPIWKELCLTEDSPLRRAMEIIDTWVDYQIAIVVDTQDRVVGTVTDGDCRRAILRKFSADAPVRDIMNKTPITAPQGMLEEDQQNIMRKRGIRQLLLTDEAGRVAAVSTISRAETAARKRNPVCLMAGGLGSRLSPLTQDTPKPLITVGDRPILETTLRNFVEQGFHDFYISVNYQAEKIKRHFGDGREFGCQINYIEEKQRLGTAGALSLIAKEVKHPILVKNGDLLTRTRYDCLVDFHENRDTIATMAVREHRVEIPFGVVDIEEDSLQSITEKPVKKMFVSAGMYILDPEALTYIPYGVYFDMPSLFHRLNDAGRHTGVFPVHEYWIDIGSHEQLEQARKDYHTQFIAGKRAS